MEVHDVLQVPLSEAMSAGLGECFNCFPRDVPVDAKPCNVLVGERWVDGLLISWEKNSQGRWIGTVSYQGRFGRITALVDQSRLRSRS